VRHTLTRAGRTRGGRVHEERLALTSRLDDTQKTGGGGQALLRQQRHRPLVQLPMRHESDRSRRLRQRPLNDPLATQLPEVGHGLA